MIRSTFWQAVHQSMWRAPRAIIHDIRNPVATRLDYIDSLRGVAALMVFLTHSTELLYAGTGSRLGSYLLKFGFSVGLGQIGVVLFFAISGFVIPYTLERSHRHGLSDFVFSRLFRLYPAFWLSIPCAAAVEHFLLHSNFSFSDIILNATMLPGWLGATAVNGAYWTLEVEALFYLVCIILYIGRSDRIPFVYSTISLLGTMTFLSSQPTIFRDILNSNLSPQIYFYGSFLSVMCWAAVMRQLVDGKPVDPISKVCAVGVGSFYLLYQPWRLVSAYIYANFVDIDQRLILAYSASLLVFLLGISVMKIRWLPLVFLGRVSYSFYLFHGPILLAERAMILHFRFYFPGELHICEFFGFVFTTVMSSISYEYVEKPSIRIGRRIANALRPAGKYAMHGRV